jgi:hypothetical protein
LDLAEAVHLAVRRSSYKRPTSKGGTMKYMLLIHQGDAPTPYAPEGWGRLSEDERNEIAAAYQELNATPGVTPGLQLQPPEAATTVRVQDGRTLPTDGPFASV